VQLVFLSTFNTPYMCLNIRRDGVKSFWVGTNQGLNSDGYQPAKGLFG
jgi:hypothetical protein